MPPRRTFTKETPRSRPPDRRETDSSSAIRYDGGRHPTTGAYHGRGTLYWRNGTRFEGRFVDGKRHGHGRLFLLDGTAIAGHFHKDVLSGEAEYTYAEGRSMVATHDHNGNIHGPAVEYSASGSQILAQGEYVHGKRVGIWTFGLEGGGTLRGPINKNGRVEGKDVVYWYPDGSGLKGVWKDGLMVKAHYFPPSLNPSTLNNDTTPLETTVHYVHDPSTCDHISLNPLLPDPYERCHVAVRPSMLEGAGEGLFATVDIPGLMPFYIKRRWGYSVWKSSYISSPSRIFSRLTSKLSPSTTARASRLRSPTHATGTRTPTRFDSTKLRCWMCLHRSTTRPFIGRRWDTNVTIIGHRRTPYLADSTIRASAASSACAPTETSRRGRRSLWIIIITRGTSRQAN